MKLTRLLFLTAFALFAAGISRADIVPGHFTINMNNDQDGSPNTDPLGAGGWLSGQTFTVTANITEDTSLFHRCVVMQQGDSGPFVYSYNDECVVDDTPDPTIRVDPGGASDPLAGFTTDEAGGGVFDYFNPGPDAITSLLVQTTYPDNSPIFDGGFFDCHSTIFTFCGLQFPNEDQVVLIYFSGGPGIPAAVPEPAYSVVFLAAAGLLVWAVKARRSQRV